MKLNVCSLIGLYITCFWLVPVRFSNFQFILIPIWIVSTWKMKCIYDGPLSQSANRGQQWVLLVADMKQKSISILNSSSSTTGYIQPYLLMACVICTVLCTKRKAHFVNVWYCIMWQWEPFYLLVQLFICILLFELTFLID